MPKLNLPKFQPHASNGVTICKCNKWTPNAPVFPSSVLKLRNAKFCHPLLFQNKLFPSCKVRLIPQLTYRFVDAYHAFLFSQGLLKETLCTTIISDMGRIAQACLSPESQVRIPATLAFCYKTSKLSQHDSFYLYFRSVGKQNLFIGRRLWKPQNNFCFLKSFVLYLQETSNGSMK